jgi:phosphomevalonate kinase
VRGSGRELNSVSAPNIGLDRIGFTIGDQGVPVLKDAAHQDKLRFFSAAFSQVWQNLEIKPAAPLDIVIDTSSFYVDQNAKLGLGSSAAVTCGLIKALSAVWQQEPSRQELFDTAMKIHHKTQGNLGSGIDIAASVYGGLLSYQKKISGPEMHKIEFPADLVFMPVWTGNAASTPDLVSRVMKFRRSDPAQYQKLMADMSQSSEKAAAALISGETDNFLGQVGKYGELMDGLGKHSGAPIISEVHRKIEAVIKSCRGFYKPSGAGGGDLGLGFWKRAQFTGDTRQELEERGLDLVPLQIDTGGTLINKL